MRVQVIVMVPSDTSCRFISLGRIPLTPGAVTVLVDFTKLTTKRCVLDADNPGHDDFELWSPSEECTERCLLGRQTLYHRRVWNTRCVIGDQPKAKAKVVNNCACSKVDFECEFNHVRNSAGDCVLVEGTTPLPDVDLCKSEEEFWYEWTVYRLIPYSSCIKGVRPDRGVAHQCPGFRVHGALFWLFIILIPFTFTALVAYYYYRRSGIARGNIRLPGDMTAYHGYRGAGLMDTLASVPWFLIGVVGITWEWVVSKVDDVGFRSRRGYRDVPVDEDAQILQFEDGEWIKITDGLVEGWIG